jgi:hypothetical protein
MNMNIFELLRKEEVRLLKILRKLEDTSSREIQERELLLHQVRIHALTLNEILREHFYPTVVLSLGKEEPRLLQAVERAQEDDAEIERILEGLAEMQPWERSYKLLVERLVAQARLNAQWRERELFERASRLMPEGQAADLGEMVVEELNGARRSIERS